MLAIEEEMMLSSLLLAMPFNVLAASSSSDKTVTFLVFIH